MQSNRALLWVVLIGAAVVAGVYYFRTQTDGTAPPAQVPATPEAAAPVRPQVSQPSSPAETSPADQTAAEAAETLKRIEAEQQNEMMEKVR